MVRARFYYAPLVSSVKVTRHNAGPFLCGYLLKTVMNPVDPNGCLFASGHQRSVADILKRSRFDIDSVLSFAIRTLRSGLNW